MKFAIDVRGLNKYFGKKKVVDDLSLQVRPGEIFGFLGPNGSGKTTSIRLMCGLLTPDSGSGTCLGYDIIAESDAIKRNVGYMTQRFSFWEDLSIRENLDFIARVYQMPDRKASVENALNNLGLKARANQLAGTLSGGWKQRLALAACMLHRPALLLLDEPTAGVDPSARRDFWEELHRLAAQGISVLVSTHYMDEAERCHKLAYISHGALLAQGTAQEIVAAQQLFTWAIKGKMTDESLTQLSDVLASKPGVLQTAAFGNALHVTGRDPLMLEKTLRETVAGLPHEMVRTETSLEDVFIHLMRTPKETREPLQEQPRKVGQ
ncbi:MAG: ABC transporter ATP-binding protein [Proteobacteria bacterium]|nr:ABC transporter ATP-binding protein [Pseudomonadota bacterium]MCL2306948.1 ABC transporter ATP-binding protein [Pseudomonadota bacterium]